MIGMRHRFIRRLASLRVTLLCLGAAAVVALLGGDQDGWPIGVTIALPFGLLVLNLVAALATNVTLRTSAGLLGFHLALAVLALLAAADRLTGLTGHVEVTEGVAFDPALVEAEAGPLHPWGLDSVRFLQGGFSITYAPGMKRRETVSTVYLPGDSGAPRGRTVGDDAPLVIGGYRFYTSFNKGFAPIVTVTDQAGTNHTGAIHLPSYPLNYFQQGNDWRVPGTGQSIKVWLHLPDEIYDEDDAWNFRKPADARLVVMADGVRRELRPGDRVALGAGHLRYEELRTWMGYTISFNPLIPWMLATVGITVACLAWHVVAKIRATPWDGTARVPVPVPTRPRTAGMDRERAYVR